MAEPFPPARTRAIALCIFRRGDRILVFEGFDPATDRLTLTEVRRLIYEQSGIFQPEDIIPVPCHPDCLAMAYALKLADRVVPLTGMVDPRILIEGGRNTIVFEQDAGLRARLFAAFSTVLGINPAILFSG